MDLATFISALLSQRNVGDTQENAGQCVGLVERWLDANKKPHIWGDAKDLMTNAPPSVFKVTANLPLNAPQPGNIVCWDSSWGLGHGHTAIVIAANIRSLAVFEQNNPIGSAPIVWTHGYTGVAGWISW
jgi:hypothetical protein